MRVDRPTFRRLSSALARAILLACAVLEIAFPTSASATEVGHWTLDGSWADSSVTNASTSNSANPNDAAFAPGRFGQGGSFDGDDKVVVASNAAYDLTVFTVQAWFRTSDASAPKHSIISKYPGLSNFDLRVEGGELASKITACGGTAYYPWGTAVADGQWHFAALTVGADKVARLYQDGQLKQALQLACVPDTPAGSVTLGVDTTAGSAYFVGAIDDAIIHDRALAASEIREIYEQASPEYSGTSFDGSGCRSGTAATALGSFLPGPVLTSVDCVLRFGATDDRARLRVAQSDQIANPMNRLPDGQLDSSYGTAGKVAEDMGNATETAKTGAFDRERNRTYVVGDVGSSGSKDIGVLALNASGTPDTAFSSDGKRVDSWNAGDDGPGAAAVQPDGKLLVAGQSGAQGILIRYLPDGSLDSTFSGDGVALISGAKGFGDLVLLPNGQFYATGFGVGASNDDFTTARFNADGTLDRSFGNSGITKVEMGAWDYAASLLLLPNGKLLLVGTTTATDVAFLRLYPDGTPDTTLNGNGKASASLSTTSAWIEGAELLDSGKIVTTGFTNNGTNDVITISQFDQNGVLDTGFGVSGKRQVQVGPSWSYSFGITTSSDGRIYAAGEEAGNSLVVLAVNRNGDLDTTFDGDGVFLGSHSGGTWGQELIEGPDGSLSGIGSVQTGAPSDFSVQRLGTATTNNYSGSNNWASGGSMFGACLRTGSGISTGAGFGWTTDANTDCTAADSDPWNAVSASGSHIATTDSLGQSDAKAKVRFGSKMTSAQTTGTYVAPVSFEVIAPNLYPPANTAVPTIDDTTPTARQTVTANPGSWSGSPTIRYTYQWKLGGTPIAGATSQTYAVRFDDVGSALSVTVTATNSEGSASATSAASTNVANAALAGLGYLTGFEHGTIATEGGGISDYGTGAPSIDSKVAHTGAYSERITTTSSTAQTKKNLTSAIGVSRSYIYFRNTPDWTTAINQWDDGVSASVYVGIETDGRFKAALYKSGVGHLGTVYGPQVLPGHWYQIDMRVNATTAANWTLDWSIDGVNQPSTSANFGYSGTLNGFNWGVMNNCSTDMNIDDVALSNASADYPIGAGVVHGLTPNAAATHNTPGSFGQSVNNGGAFGAITDPGSYDLINEWPITTGGSADLIRQTVTGTALTDYLQYDMTNSPIPVDPQGVQILAATREAAAGADNVTVRTRVGANTQSPVSGNPAGGTATPYYFGGLSARPGGGAWTDTDINSLQLELDSTDVTVRPWTDALLAEVAYPTTGLDNAARPVITGTPRVGQTLSSTTGSWSDTPTGYVYQWLRCDSQGLYCIDVGTNSSTYTLVVADKAKTILLDVTALSPYGNQSARSTQTPLIAAQTPTLTYLTGFEHGTIDATGGGIASALGSASPTISAVSHNGRYGMQVDKINGQASNRIRYGVTASNEAVLRAWVRIDRLPTSGTNLGLMYAEPTAGNDFQFRLNDQGKMFVQLGASSSVSATPITLAKWYMIEMHATASSNPRTLEWSINGTAQTTIQSAEAASQITNTHFGSKWNTDNGLSYFDDIAVSQTGSDYPIGNGKVVGLAPDGTGTHNPTIANFQYSSLSALAGANFTALTSGDNAQTPGTAQLLDDWPANGENFTTLSNPYSAANDYCGSSTAVGDVNGDGRGDVVMGCPGNEDGASDAGSAVVLTRNSANTGYDTGVELDNPYPAVSDFCGTFVATGDVNNDGRDDVIMGCYGNEDGAADAGSAVVFISQGGSPASFSAGVELDNNFPTTGDFCGKSVAAGDVTGDGRADVIVGCESNDDGAADSGSAIVYTSTSGSLASFAAGVEIDNNFASASDNCGHAVASGDLNDDGRDDVIMGCNMNDDGASNAGSMIAFVSSGGSPIAFATGVEVDNNFAAIDDYCGNSVTTGDIDGNGRDDVIMGCHGNNDGAADAGSVISLVSNGGAPITFAAGVETDNNFAAADDYCGFSVASGDVNSDGRDDVVFGCLGNDDGVADAGSEVVLTSNGGAPVTYATGIELDGPAAANWCGWSVGAGDVTGTGRIQPVMGCYVGGASSAGHAMSASTADVYEQIATGAEYAEFTMADTSESAAPNAIRIISANREATNAANNVNIDAVDGGNISNDVINVDPNLTDGTTTPHYHAAIMTTKPGGGGPWTATILNNLKLRLDSSGAGGAGSRPRTDALLVEADFPASDPPVMTKRPAISVPGDWPRQGETLTVSNGSWTNVSHDYTYQWQSCTAAGVCADLPVTTLDPDSYTITTGDLGNTIRAVVCARGPGGTQCAMTNATAEAATAIPSEAYVTGFEHAAVSLAGAGLFDQQGGATTSADTAVKRSGNYSLKTDSTGTQPWVSKQVTGGAVSVTRFAFYLDSLPTGTTGIQSWTTTNFASRPDPSIRISSTGQLQVAYYDGSWQGIQTGATLQTGQWYTIDARLDSRTTNWKVDWRVNGAVQPPSVYSTNTATETSNYTYIGLMQSGVTGIAHYDDWAVSLSYNDYPIKRGKVLPLTASGLGLGGAGLGNFQDDDLSVIDSTTWTRLDDIPLTGVTDYVRQTTNSTTSYVETTFTDTPETSNALGIRGVMSYHAANTTLSNGETRIHRLDGTDSCIGSSCTVGTPWDMSENTLFYKGSMIAAPTTGWSPLEVNALTGRMGYSSDTTNDPYWDGLMLEVDYPDSS